MVYTDGVHMVADSLKELHDFAASIDLKRCWFHGVKKGHPHYDLWSPIKLAQAIAAGAVSVGKKEILEKSKLLSNETKSVQRKNKGHDLFG